MILKRTCFLSIGSNVGRRLVHLRRAVLCMPDVVGVSSVYETEPLGGPAGQRAYLNAVVALFTDLRVREVLETCRQLESAAGRVRSVRWGPRTLDVDILLVGDEHCLEDDLVVPHPRMWERRFVLEPLGELAPELLPEGWQDHVAGKVTRVARL